MLVVVCVTSALSAGVGPAAATVDGEGVVEAWGSNPNGQLGDGSFDDRFSVGPVAGLDDIVDLDAGRGHGVALRSNGTVVAWGRNDFGQVGDGTTRDRTTAVPVAGLTSVVAVAAGHYHSMALHADGTVSTWGFNADGQLGDGTTTHRSSPVAVGGLSGVTAIAAGRDMSYAISGGGRVWAWGRNIEGQLGDGTTTSRSSPVRVQDLNRIQDVAGGRDHGLAVDDDGRVWAWGDNTYGQLGDATTTQRSEPVAVANLTTAIQVAAGAHHSQALLGDGSIASWGRNQRGQLGDGTTRRRTTPVAVVGISTAASIGTGRDHGLAVLTDGSVRAWGWNDFGQLGDGTTTTRTSPIVVPGVSDAEVVHGGQNFSVSLVAVAPDRVTPSRPGRPAGSSNVAGTIDLTWNAASDDIWAVLTYDVIRDGQTVGSISSDSATTVSFRDRAVAPGTEHTYRVVAIDGAANRSRPSLESAVIREPSPLLQDDFSSGTFDAWTRSWRLAIDMASGRPAAPSAIAEVSDQKAFARFSLPQPVSAVCASAEIRLTDMSGRGITLLRFRTETGLSIARLKVNASRVLVLRSDVARAQLNTDVRLGGGWTELELCAEIAEGSLELSKNGEVIATWMVDLGLGPVGEFQLGESRKRTFTARFDTVVVARADEATTEGTP